MGPSEQWLDLEALLSALETAEFPYWVLERRFFPGLWEEDVAQVLGLRDGTPAPTCVSELAPLNFGRLRRVLLFLSS